MQWFHVTARAYRVETPLCDFPIAPTFWSGLETAFPDALAGVIMPNHAHVIALGESSSEVRDRMRWVASGVRRSAGGESVRWEPIGQPVLIPTLQKLWRDTRYVALNPCRAKLVRDPLAWLWSTYREGFGAVAETWVPFERLVTILADGEDPTRFRARFHKYVSADATTDVNGTPLPIVAVPSNVATYPLSRIAAAASASHRSPLRAIERKRSAARRTFIPLAAECGWVDPAAVARAAGASEWTVRRGFASRDQVERAAWVCLGDMRFTSELLTDGVLTGPPRKRISFEQDLVAQ